VLTTANLPGIKESGWCTEVLQQNQQKISDRTLHLNLTWKIHGIDLPPCPAFCGAKASPSQWGGHGHPYQEHSPKGRTACTTDFSPVSSTLL